MQNSDLWTRKTSLYGSQTWPVALWVQNSVISIRLTNLCVSQPSSVFFCAYKTAWLASELLVSMSPISHVWFLDAKQQLLDRYNKSLWVPDITCRCVHENSVIRTRISSLYVSQASSLVLSTHNCELNTRIKRQYWIQPSLVALCMQNSDFRTRITSLWGSKTSPVVFSCKTAPSGPE